MAQDDLLTPSLSTSKFRPLYSVGALLGAAFFGGAISTVFMGALNAHRLGYLGKHAIWWGGALAVSVGMLYLLMVESYFELSNSTVRLLNRGLGFFLVGVFYLVYRQQYRSMSAMGTDAPSPWLPVIGSVVASYIVLVGLLAIRGVE